MSDDDLPFKVVRTNGHDEVIARAANLIVGRAAYEAPQRVIADAEGLMVTLERDRAKPAAAALNGVLVFTDSAVAAGGATTAIRALRRLPPR